MRRWCSVFVIGLMWAAGARGQFTRDIHDKEEKETDQTDLAQAWEKYRQQLVKGAVYQTEVVLRYDDEGLFYYRVLFGPQAPRPQMFGLGIDARGRCVPPPDPMRVRVHKAAQAVSKAGDHPPPPPLAFDTRYLDVELDKSETGADLRVSDLGTTMPLPKKAGDMTRLYFNAYFRITRLTEDQAKVAQPLRLEAKAVLARLAELRQEAVGDLANLRQYPEQLSEATEIWQDTALLQVVRQWLSEWIDRTPEEVSGKGFPNHLCHALGRAGSASDFALFHRLVRRHRDDASYVNYPTLLLLQRAKAKEAKPLVSDLLHDPTPLQAEQKYVLMLRQFDPTIPVPTSGDDFLRTLTTMFRLKPEQFYFSLVQAQLLPIRDRFKLTPQEVQYLKDTSENRSGDWIMLTKQDRQRGYKAALQWLDEMK